MRGDGSTIQSREASALSRFLLFLYLTFLPYRSSHPPMSQTRSFSCLGRRRLPSRFLSERRRRRSLRRLVAERTNEEGGRLENNGSEVPQMAGRPYHYPFALIITTAPSAALTLPHTGTTVRYRAYPTHALAWLQSTSSPLDSCFGGTDFEIPVKGVANRAVRLIY